MLLLVFLFLTATPIVAQDETSEDAFEIRHDQSQENEGMEGFAVSTDIVEPESTTTLRIEVTTPSISLPDETMAEDPFESSPVSSSDSSVASSSSTVINSPDVSVREPAVDTISTDETTPETTPEVTVEPLVTTSSDANVEVASTGEVEASTEIEETIPTVADVWTTSTETAERRVLKEKSGEELANKDPIDEMTTEEAEETTTIQEVSTTVEAMETTVKEEGEEESIPFDSTNLGGLFEADGSPKVEESPTFPLTHLPAKEQTEQSVEIIEKEKTTTEETLTEKSPESSTEKTKEEVPTTVRTTEEPPTEMTSEISTLSTQMPKMMEPPRPPMLRPQSLSQTPLTFKITSIEWMADFANNTSGKFRKLAEQILPELNNLLKNELGDDFVAVSIDSLTKGSVVVNAIMSTKETVGDPEQLATRLESTISSSGSHLGGNSIDPASITVNGIPSRAYLDKVNASYAPTSTSPLLIAAIIGVASVLLILIIVLICLVNGRKSHGGMKMGSISQMEEAQTRGQGVPQLNLMSYANSTRNTGMPPPRADEREVA